MILKYVKNNIPMVIMYLSGKIIIQNDGWKEGNKYE